MKILRYFFYKIYSYSLSNGETDAGWAMTIVSVFCLANISTLYDVIIIITKIKSPQFDKIFIVGVCICILYYNYSTLMKNGKSSEIIKEFNETKESRLKLNVFLILYIILSIVLVIFTANIIRQSNS